MKKKLLFPCIIFLNLSICLSQSIKKQTHIPMDNRKGIPYGASDGDIDVDGFEVDENGSFYFLGGTAKASVLVKFNGNTVFFRYVYKEFIGTALYRFNHNFYTFNTLKNSIYELNSNGLMNNQFNRITPNSVNTYRFCDGKLILDIIGGPEINPPSNLIYNLYNLSGKKITNVPNNFNLPSVVINGNKGTINATYLGKWNKNYVFWSVDEKRDAYQKIYMVNSMGKTLKTAYFKKKEFGDGFENIEGTKKLRNKSIYILGHNKKDGIITELSLIDIFK